MSIRTKYEQELSFVFNKLVSMCRATELALMFFAIAASLIF